MFTLVICDDHKPHLEAVGRLIAQYQKHTKVFTIRTFVSSLELRQQEDLLARADVFLLDIVMPDYTGLELGQAIRSVNPEAIILYFTTSHEFALEAYGVNALEYLLKPVSKEALFKAFDRVLVLARQKARTVFIETRTQTIPVKCHEVLFIEYRDHVLHYHLRDTTMSSKVYRVPFAQAAAELFEHPDFLMVHRAFLVNLKQVKTLHSTSLEMQNLAQVPIAKSKLKEVKEAYIRFLIGG